MRFIGDIHGNLISYLFLRGDAKESIQVGDFGIGFIKDRELKQFLEGNDDEHHRFIRGNHDNLNGCIDIPCYIEDGRIETINDKKVMFIGGASSIDRASRVEGINWWADEELSYEEFQYLVDEYKKEKPDVLITHECPRQVRSEFFQPRDVISSRTSNAFGLMWEMHKPSLWVFGHWHLPLDEVLGPTRFVCVDKDSAVDIDI